MVTNNVEIQSLFFVTIDREFHKGKGCWYYLIDQ